MSNVRQLQAGSFRMANRKLPPAAPSRTPVEPKFWERLCAALVLVGALGAGGVVVLLAGVEPKLFLAAVTSRAVPWYSLLLPVLLVSAAVLLVRMSRWAFPLLALHLV